MILGDFGENISRAQGKRRRNIFSHNKGGSNPPLKGRLKNKASKNIICFFFISLLSIMHLLNTLFGVVNGWMLS